jgi:predicted transcriptional regulator
MMPSEPSNTMTNTRKKQPMGVLVIEEQQLLFASVRKEVRALVGEIERFNIEVKAISKNLASVHKSKIISFPKTNISHH